MSEQRDHGVDGEHRGGPSGGRVLIVGGGLAGVRTAVELRERGHDGPITLLGAEPRLPYDRPPLSKAALLGEADGDEPLVPAADLAAAGITVLTGRRAEGLRPADREVDTGAGPLPWDRLVIATGADPVPLPGPAAGAPGDTGGDGGVHTLRTAEDARALRAVLDARRHLVIIGAGWIGAEVATAARRTGCPVTVLEAGPQPLAGTLPAEVAAPMRAWYAEIGAELRTDARVSGIGTDAVVLADGTTVAAGAVLVGIGARAATAWTAGSGLPLGSDGTVTVDHALRAGLPDIWAAGDCAAHPSARYGRRMAVQHWDDALRAAATVASGVLGEPVAHDPVPYFWSEQFGRMLQWLGAPGPDDRILYRGDPADPTRTVVWLDARNVPTAVLTVDRPRDLAQARRIIERRTPLDPDRAADPELPLKAAVRAP
ncbi:FAD-dependent oxidoreductase [Streptomyces sp. ST2-7A]|uniref:NAD(P)/FAD-dependent oxidoreductase n=1 Tax=Streptomyces sp. ST2-7A TaxID=2907214 RepID=UPI001F33F224|nr:FAD-dependent oxidoreductase [Streptomyces sp. ST2-7A]MCE7083149.1 FAD-dependent oxidoreductase [Streptomyces sp. ST2-7A]